MSVCGSASSRANEVGGKSHTLSLIFEDNGHFADEVHKDPFIGLPASQGSQSS
jgi:hypothetical protein